MWISWDTSQPNKLYRSNASKSDDFVNGGVYSLTSPVTGLCASLQTLYIFTESTIDMMNSWTIKQVWSTLDYSSIPVEANEWAYNHNCIVAYGRSVFFLSNSLKIKKVSPNQFTYDIEELSHRANRGITHTMDNLDSDQSTSFAYGIPEKQIIKWHLKSKWSPYNDLCIVYNVEYDEFMVDTNKVFYGGINFNGWNYTISQLEPKIFQDEYW
jgi:hypothetical protein